MSAMRPFPMSEREFWAEVKGKLTEGHQPLLTAVEAVRDEHDINQIHIACMNTRIGFTIFDVCGRVPAGTNDLDTIRGLIDEHCSRLD